ncbi:hypothetical protein AO924_35315 [Pseudomonas aeruginosa]|nr:hypothetical protein AO924_35315 [Pseudomonas aeruginosa]
MTRCSSDGNPQAHGRPGVRRVFCLTMTPARHFAGLRLSPIQQVYQSLRRVQHMPVLSET